MPHTQMAQRGGIRLMVTGSRKKTSSANTGAPPTSSDPSGPWPLGCLGASDVPELEDCRSSATSRPTKDTSTFHKRSERVRRNNCKLATCRDLIRIPCPVAPSVPEMKLKVSPARACSKAVDLSFEAWDLWLHKLLSSWPPKVCLDESALSHGLLANQNELRPGRKALDGKEEGPPTLVRKTCEGVETLKL